MQTFPRTGPFCIDCLNYSHNTVTHITSEKAYSITVHGHILVDSAVVHQLMSQVIVADDDNDVPCGEW